MKCGVVGHNFERDHLRTIPAKFGLIWFSSFRGEDLRFRFVVFKAAFNNISVISWRSIVLVGGIQHSRITCIWSIYLSVGPIIQSLYMCMVPIRISVIGVAANKEATEPRVPIC
jgi:hypothetical protein